MGQKDRLIARNAPSLIGVLSAIVKVSREILGQWLRQEKPCPHDFYLKVFHRDGDFYKALNTFEMVLVDEGQDLSPIMLDALEHCRKRIIIVGDTHQQIYSFRYAIDAMKRFPFDEERDLTMSFRFGRDIAEVASLLIQETKDEKGFKIRGNPQKTSRVALYTDLPRPKAGEPCAILSRTNLALFEKALGLRSRGIGSLSPWKGTLAQSCGRLSMSTGYLKRNTTRSVTTSSSLSRAWMPSKHTPRTLTISSLAAW
jgi:hypothetical protein